jgi:hypothetical protein
MLVRNEILKGIFLVPERIDDENNVAFWARLLVLLTDHGKGQRGWVSLILRDVLDVVGLL